MNQHQEDWLAIAGIFAIINIFMWFVLWVVL